MSLKRRLATKPRLECLEDRFLPSVTFGQFYIPTSDSIPEAITAEASGAVWFVEHVGNNVAELLPGQGINEFPIPTANSGPEGITIGPNGTIWFGEVTANQIGEFIPSTESFHDYPIHTASSYPWSLTYGPQGAVWFIENDVNKIAEINPTTGVITEHPIPAGGGPGWITTGPNGTLWFTQNSTDVSEIGEFNPNTGEFTFFPTPTANAECEEITPGPNNTLWFAEYNASQIGVINATTGAITEFRTPTPNSRPWGIATSPSGLIWFTEYDANELGVIDPTTNAVTEYPISGASAVPLWITVSPETGNVWFAENQLPAPANYIWDAVLPSGSTLTVTTTADSGSASLRQAILTSNAASLIQTPDAINFDIASGVQTFTPGGPLPPITTPTIIDATPPSGFLNQMIVLDGAAAGPAADIAVTGRTAKTDESKTKTTSAATDDGSSRFESGGDAIAAQTGRHGNGAGAKADGAERAPANPSDAFRAVAVLPAALGWFQGSGPADETFAPIDPVTATLRGSPDFANSVSTLLTQTIGPTRARSPEGSYADFVTAEVSPPGVPAHADDSFWFIGWEESSVTLPWETLWRNRGSS